MARLGSRRTSYGRPAIPDIDIYRAANAVIKQYGDEAPVHAAMRTDNLPEAGGLEGQRIIAAIKELKSMERPPSATTHKACGPDPAVPYQAH